MIPRFPICSMYGIFTYVWVIFRENVGKYTIHGAYGLCMLKILANYGDDRLDLFRNAEIAG